MTTPAGRAVYLHGRGLVSRLGHTLDDAIGALGGPPPSPQRASLGDLSWPWQPVGEGPHPAPLPDDPQAWTERLLAFAADAARQAQARRDGWLIVASSSFDMGSLERGAPWHGDGLAFVEHIARHLQWQGPVCAVATACTSAVNALARAHRLLAAGVTNDVLVLGVEAGNRYSLAGFSGLQLVAPWPDAEGSPPEAGLVLGEAVAALALSGQPARWRLAACAHRVSGDDPAGPTASALDAALADALESAQNDADLPAQAIAWVKAHATGNPASDSVENRILCAHLPDTAHRTGLKKWLGHTQGASAAAELALLTRAIETGHTPALSLQPKPIGSPGEPTCSGVVSLTLGFGGGHGVVVLKDQGHAPLPLERPPQPTLGREPSAWRVTGRCSDPCGPDWREDLIRRLGQRPRRLGTWTERALHGALCCLENAGETTLPADAELVVCSFSGPVQAVRTALEALRQGFMPMPYTFLQSQAAVMLSALAAHLRWMGDAQALAMRDPARLFRLVLQGAPQAGVLLGWVEEDGPCRWWRLRPAQNPRDAGQAPWPLLSALETHGTPPPENLEGLVLD